MKVQKDLGTVLIDEIFTKFPKLFRQTLVLSLFRRFSLGSDWSKVFSAVNYRRRFSTASNKRNDFEKNSRVTLFVDFGRSGEVGLSLGSVFGSHEHVLLGD